MLGRHGKGKPHRHPLGNIVEGDRQHQERRPVQGSPHPFRTLLPQMEMGHQKIQQIQEKAADHKASRRRNPGNPSRLPGLVYGRYQQWPYGSSHHHSRRKTKKSSLHIFSHILFKNEYHTGAQSRHQKSESRTCGSPTDCLAHIFLFSASFTLRKLCSILSIYRFPEIVPVSFRSSGCIVKQRMPVSLGHPLL